MVNRPCLHPGCPRIQPQPRCPIHARNKNLARDKLNEIGGRDRWVCQLCGHPVDRTLRGTRTPKSPSLHHLAGTSDHPGNIILTHLVCNQRLQ